MYGEINIFTLIDNELQPYLFIRSLSSRSIPSVEGFSLCRQREGWASRLGMGREQRLKGIYSLTK